MFGGSNDRAEQDIENEDIFKGDALLNFLGGLQLLGALFALVSAAFWFIAALDSAPAEIATEMRSRAGSETSDSDLAALLRAIRRQSRYSALAAASAGCAALLLAVQGVRPY